MNDPFPYDDLDTSWVNKEETLYSLQTNYYKTHMESVLCYLIYVGNDLSIQKIAKHKEPLEILNENGENGIHYERLLQLIQRHRILGNGLKYKIWSLSKYNVDLEHNVLCHYINKKTSHVFFKEISFLEKIVIEPSLPIFHSLNSLYFIFKEDVMVKKSVKSILKIESPSLISRTTKKVKIHEEMVQPKKTRKQKLHDSSIA